MFLSEDEYILYNAILEARNVQEFLWGDDSLRNEEFNPDVWANVFQKRVIKISQIKPNSPHATIELRKRVLQQAGLSILALKIIDKQSKSKK